jgi:hypothetical protein
LPSDNTAKPPGDRGGIGARARHLRSAVTNNRRLFVQGDGNSAWSRRYRDLIAGHVSDLGGADMLSEAQLSLVKRASALEVELELAEGKLSAGEPIDMDLHLRGIGALRRTLESIGLARVPKPIQSLHERIAAMPSLAAAESISVADGTQPTSATNERATGLPTGSEDTGNAP